MFNQIIKINDIDHYKIKNSILVYKDKRQNIFRNFEKVSECGYDDVFLINTSILFNNREGNILIINEKEEVFKKKSVLLNFTSDNIGSNQLLYLDSLENLNLYELNSELDYSLYEINYNWENIILSNKENIIFLIGNSYIHVYTLPDATPLWQYNLGELGTYKNSINEVRDYEVKQFVGVYQGQFIVRISDASFLFLDINTGKMLKVFQINELFPLPSPVFYSDRCNAHLEENKIIWLNNQILLHIDLLTYEVMVIKKFYEEIREQQYRFMSNTYFKGKIYFVADYGWQYVTPSSIGVMNADTGEVIWREQLKKTGGLPEVPQVTDEKLYVRTANNELYIFEKN